MPGAGFSTGLPRARRLLSAELRRGRVSGAFTTGSPGGAPFASRRSAGGLPGGRGGARDGRRSPPAPAGRPRGSPPRGGGSPAARDEGGGSLEPLRLAPGSLHRNRLRVAA